MNEPLVAAVFLIAVPTGFNVAFLALARAFDYPGILREPPDTILRRFHAGGPGLLRLWQAFLFSAAAMWPLVALVAVVLAAAPALTVSALLIGSAAALVQTIGLARWPFAVPELARRYVEANGPDAETTRKTVEIVFATLHRLLGVGIGEHLGYLLTGVWTLLTAASVMTTLVLPTWLGLLGLPIGLALVIGSFEFVGSNEKDGWALAGVIVPIAYLAWSAWLIAMGLILLPSAITR